MTTLDAAPSFAPADPRRLIAVAGVAVLLAAFVFLTGAFMQGFFIADESGHGIPNEPR